MTDQEIFDRVIAHLRKQGRPALDENGDCAYRYDNGQEVLMCAVGCLIDDAHYHLSLEGETVYESKRVQDALVASIGPLRNFRLLSHLQHAHDYRWVPRGPSCFREVAKKHGLDPSALEGWA